jgi:stage II sporulation protein D
MSVSVFTAANNRINFSFFLFVFTLYLPILLLAQATHSTVDVRVLEIFHPHNLNIVFNRDTIEVELENGILHVDGKKKSVFFIQQHSKIFIKDKITRQYEGTTKIYPGLDEIIIINRVPIGAYLSSVVGAEMGKAPLEAQKAQAIVSRTYLFKNFNRHGKYDFCDLTHCQVYKGKESASAVSRTAVSETDNILLWDGNKLAEVYYHSTCGGKTASFSSIFKGKNQSLVSVSDSNLCEDSPHYVWEWKLSIKDAPFKLIKTIKRNQDGRIVELEVDGKKEDGWGFRMRIARIYGWNKLRSSWFTVEKKDDYFLFKGRGLGHGLGMCQWGAKKMAEQGKTAEEILKHYFPKLEVR